MKKHLEVTGIGNLVFYQTYLKILGLKIPWSLKTKTFQQLSDEIDENYDECISEEDISKLKIEYETWKQKWLSSNLTGSFLC